MFSCCRISIFYNIQTRALLQKVPYRIIHWIILHVYNHKLINEQSSSRYQLNSIILSYKSADTCHLFAAMFSYEVFASLIILSYIYGIIYRQASQTLSNPAFPCYFFASVELNKFCSLEAATEHSTNLNAL
jgi:hypothetical protein